MHHCEIEMCHRSPNDIGVPFQIGPAAIFSTTPVRDGQTMHPSIRSLVTAPTEGWLVLLAVASPAAIAAQTTGPARFVNPSGLSKPTGFTHVVVAPDGRTVYIAGQVASDSTGRIVGAGDFRAQVEQVYANLGRALASVGGSFKDVVKTTTFLTDLTQVAVLREVRARFLDPAHPPASTAVQVAGLVRPELMIEIEAVAVLSKPWRL